MAGFLPSQADCDPVQNILEWQSQQLQVQPSDYVEEAADHNAIAGLTASLLSLFKAIIPALAREQPTKIPQTARISLERSCSALILWSSGYGIAEGRLNDAFNRSRKLRYTTLKNLLHIGRVLVERLLPLVNVSEKLQALCSSVESNIEEAAGIIAEASSRQSDDSSSDAASDFSNDDIHEIAEDLKTDTLVLSSLDPLLKYPIFDTQSKDAADGVAISTWSPEKLFSDRIEHRFPSAATPLASRLGRANYERFLRCQATRDAQEIAEALFVTNREEQAGTGTIIADSKFHDSGVGTSLGTSIVLTVPYAETTMSYNHDGQSVRIPPLSKEAKSGLPFSCIACGHNIIVTNNSGWKRHIYLDLQPYMCLDMCCPYSSTAFESRERWVAHLALDHEMEPRWESTQCALCKEQTGNGKMAVTMHLSRHLEEISLSALPVEIASDAASENTSELDDISFPSKINHGGSDRDQELSSGIDAMKTDTRRDVQDIHDPDSLDSPIETRNPWTLSDLLSIHSAAARGDVDTVAQILQTKGSSGMPEAMITAARYLRHEVFQLLLSLGANPDPDPSPVLAADYPTPMLAVIGQVDTRILELLLEQKSFNPTRIFKGETYYEIARRRQGPHWEREEHLLRTAYNNYRRAHTSLVEEESPDTGTEEDKDRIEDSHANGELQHQQPGSSASLIFEDSPPTREPTSQGKLEAHQRPYTCSICHMSFQEEADCDRHTRVLHIEKAKDYHDFLATVRSYFKDQPDKFARFINILTVILRGPCQRCLLTKLDCDAKFPNPCSRCRSSQGYCIVIATRPPRRFIKHIDVYQVVSNIGQLFEGYPSFVTQELSNLLPYQYRIEAIDHSRVRFYAPNTDPVIIEAVKRSENLQRQRTSDHPAADTNDVAKSHIEHVEPTKVDIPESWITKVKDRYIGSPHVYRQLLEILRDTQDDARSIQDAHLAAKKLFGVNRDLIDEFQILTAKGELKVDEPLLQRIRSVAQHGTGGPEQLHSNRAERGQGSMEVIGEGTKCNASDSIQILCCICHEAGSGDMIQCDNTDSCQGKWFHLVCVSLSTAPTATAKWKCPECRQRADVSEVEGSTGGSSKQKHIPTFGRINYPQPNPDIYIWPPDSYGSVDELPEGASSSYVPPPLRPPSSAKDDNTIDDEDVDPAPTEMPTFRRNPRVPRSSFVPPVSSRLREVTTYDTNVQSLSDATSEPEKEDVQLQMEAP
ncbi:hypothetical protein V8C26DRAFT_400513 [Trichoderma gracile]